MKTRIYFIFLFLTLTSAGFAQLKVDRFLLTGRQQLAREQYADALKTFNHIIRLEEDNWEAFYYRGLTKFYQGDDVGSERDFNKAIELQPNLAELYLYRGIVKDSQGELYGSLEDFNMGLEIKPDDPILLFSRGTSYLKLNNFTRAIKDFDIVVKKNPRMDEAFLNRGIAKAKLLDRDGAFLDFNEAIMLNPFSGQGHQRKGLLYYEMRNFQEALVNFSQAIQKDSTNTQSLYARALTWYEVDRKDSCIVDLNRVISLNPRHAAAIYNRAIVKAQMEDIDGAIEDYKLVNTLYPNHVLTYFNRGILWHQAGNNLNAIVDLSKAIRLYPDFAKAYLARASVYNAMGNNEAAQNDQMIAREKILLNQGKSEDELALNYADTTIQFEELISLNSNFMRSFTTLAESIEDKEFDPIGFVIFDNSGQLIVGQEGKLSDYQQINLSIKYSDFDPDKISKSDNLGNTIVFLDEGRFNEAIEILSSNISDGVLSGPSLLMRGKVRFEMIQFVLQTGVLNEVVPLKIGSNSNPGSGDFSSKVDYSEIERDFTDLINLCPEMAAAYYNRGLIRLYSQDFRGSEKDFTSAVELDPQFKEAWYNRGILRLYAWEKEHKLNWNKDEACLDLSRAGELGFSRAYNLINKICGPEK